jgi:L-alanine-DL-glutamate epimerase-like enolase superfamily enzyme
MRRLTFSAGYGIATGAASGIDTALWDIAARKEGLSLAKLLGGEERKVKRYASLSRYASKNDVVSVVGWLLGQGYGSIKLHQSGKDTLEAVRAIRNAHGSGFELSVDLNCAFNFDEASEFMKNIQRFELKWVEEPLWPPDDFDSLRELNKLGPIAAGENFFSFFEFKRLMEMDALTYYQPDVAKIGGVTPALDFLALAKLHGIKVSFHNRPDNGWLSTVASAQLASALSPEALIETPPCEVPITYFSFGGSIGKDWIEVAGPGLGIAPLESIPQSNEYEPLRFHDK